MRTKPKSRYGLRQAPTPKKKHVRLSQYGIDPRYIALFNPNHDDKGEFASGSSGGITVYRGVSTPKDVARTRAGSHNNEAIANEAGNGIYTATDINRAASFSWPDRNADGYVMTGTIHPDAKILSEDQFWNSRVEGDYSETPTSWAAKNGYDVVHADIDHPGDYVVVNPKAIQWESGVQRAKFGGPVRQGNAEDAKLSRYGLKTDPVGGQFISLFNPNHDERGRFGVGSAPKTAEHSPSGASIDAKHAIRISPEYQAKSADIVGKVNAGLTAGQDTQSQFDKIDGHVGAYTAARTEQQNQIIDSYLNKPGIAQDRQMIVMGGLPGSGKSSWLNNPDNVARLGMDPKKFVTVNSDDIKGNMQDMGMIHPVGAPDYSGLGLKQNEATGLVHEESADIAGRLNSAAMARGDNTMLDVTLNSSAQFNNKVAAIEAATGNDYRTTLVFVDTNKETSMDRAAARYWKDGAQTGRFIPTSNIGNVSVASDSGFTLNRQAYESLKSTPAVDRAILVNADGKVVEDSGWKTK